MPFSRSAITAAVVSFLAAGCAGEGTTSGLICPGGGTGAPTPTLSADVQPILSASCAVAGCHTGTSPAQSMNLSAGQTLGNTVNVPSLEVPNLARICPGNPDQSYLVHKIQGTQASVGGSGSRMPLGGQPLSQGQINTIRAWVSAGAQNN